MPNISVAFVPKSGWLVHTHASIKAAWRTQSAMTTKEGRDLQLVELALFKEEHRIPQVFFDRKVLSFERSQRLVLVFIG